MCDWCGCWCRAQIIEYAAVQSWSWNNQYNLPDPGQTFEAVLWDNGDVLFQYLDMCAPHPLSLPALSAPTHSHARRLDCRYGPLNYRTAARTLFLRPYLAHFCSVFRRSFAVFSVLTPGCQKVAPKDRGAVP